MPPPVDRRDELLAVASQLMATLPLEEVTLARIAEAAGVSWGTVRRHLGTREEILTLLAGDVPPAAESGTRKKLMAAASRTFARLGYDRASMDEIAAEAGLTKGALYWHFNSKIELFKAIMMEERARELRELPDMPRIFEEAESLEEAWSTLITELLDDLQRNSDWVWLLFEFLTSSRDPAIRELMIEGSKGINVELREQLATLREQGHLPADTSVEHTAAFWGMLVNGLAVVFLVRPELAEKADLLARPLARLVLRGLHP
ncbi:MAG: HTH-type transcriptional regulator BetI [bacterium]|nr:HTH-type transcriptional regulator BetI [bacterium]